MNRYRLSPLAVLATAALTAAAAPALAADVTLTLEGVQARGGRLLVGLQTRDQFLKQQGAYGEIIADPTAGTRTVVFRDVAPGDYSLSVLHDADGDGQMKMNGVMPAEGWTMLNAETLRAAPQFDQVDFAVPASGPIALKASMIYPAH